MTWHTEAPDSSCSGNIEAEWADRHTAVASLYHLVKEGSRWGYAIPGTGRICGVVYSDIMRWRYINGDVPSPEQQGKAILVWHWDDAPGELRSYSMHGGDEDWVVLVPAGTDHYIGWLDRMDDGCEPWSTELHDGRRVYISAHA